MIEIQNLWASIEDVAILKGINLTVKKGEIHAIMGPNGAGKSTLAKVLAGHPSYEVTEGSITFNGDDLLEKEPEERTHAGLFMSFQYPVEVPGVTNTKFLQTAYNSIRKARNEPILEDEAFEELLLEKMKLIEVPDAFRTRNVNENFSGGEKKRNEILQMAMLDPMLAILDETDSGLDIDAMRVVASGVNKVINEDKGLILITHYQRLLDYIKPDYVHVMLNGRIVESGGPELALQLEEKGYEWLEDKAAEGV